MDGYLCDAAHDRLESIGLRPRVIAGDATGDLPGEFDRIVSMVSVWHIPASWLAALRPGGRLVTTIADTGLIVTADKQPDGSALHPDGSWARATSPAGEWDGIQWSAAGAAPDYPSAQRALTPPRPETVALPPMGKLPPAPEQPFRPAVRFYRPES